MVKDEEREGLLATPCGKLFNELCKSPRVIVSSVLKILERALDMDVGKYERNKSSGPLILYACRLGVRVEGYIKYAVESHHKAMSFAEDHQGTKLRGLEQCDIPLLQSFAQQLNDMLHNRARAMLEAWLTRAGLSDGDDACLIHAHLLYLYKNHRINELDFTSVSTILSSQVFLNINHRFTTISYDDLYTNTHPEDIKDKDAPAHKPSDPPPSIQIPQNEIFDLIQTQRAQILVFVANNKEEANQAFEATVRVATNTGTRTASYEEEVRLGYRHSTPRALF